MAISKRLRYEILRRDSFKCSTCGVTGESSELRVDHVIPVALGGGDEAKNLQTLCEPCNTGKSSSAPDQSAVEAVNEKARLWSQAMQQAIAERRSDASERKLLFDAVIDKWNSWTHNNGDTVPLPGNYATSLNAFCDAGLDEDDLTELVDVAMGMRKVKDKDKWTYFCGCCWKRVRANQERAMEILGTTTDRFYVNPCWVCGSRVAYEHTCPTGCGCEDSDLAMLRPYHTSCEEAVIAAFESGWQSARKTCSTCLRPLHSRRETKNTEGATR